MLEGVWSRLRKDGSFHHIAVNRQCRNSSCPCWAVGARLCGPAKHYQLWGCLSSYWTSSALNLQLHCCWADCLRQCQGLTSNCVGNAPLFFLAFLHILMPCHVIWNIFLGAQVFLAGLLTPSSDCFIFTFAFRSDPFIFNLGNAAPSTLWPLPVFATIYSFFRQSSHE